jgi:hypothetical protein
VRRITLLLSASMGLAAHTDGALAESGPCSSMEYGRAAVLPDRVPTKVDLASAGLPDLPATPAIFNKY